MGPSLNLVAKRRNAMPSPGSVVLVASALTAHSWLAPVARTAGPRLGLGSLRAEPVVSPFEAGENSANAASEAAASLGELEFTPASVDEVLNRVRPYLVADGGDVAVVDVRPETKDVVLRLEGACGSCPSSTTTMKMGIERVLRERWPDLGSVSRDTDPENQKFDVETVEKLLAPIAGAVTKLGATLTVKSAGDEPGLVEILYKGPENVRYGVELSLLDSPLVTEVRWLSA